MILNKIIKKKSEAFYQKRTKQKQKPQGLTQTLLLTILVQTKMKGLKTKSSVMPGSFPALVWSNSKKKEGWSNKTQKNTFKPPQLSFLQKTPLLRGEVSDSNIVKLIHYPNFNENMIMYMHTVLVTRTKTTKE